MKHERASIVFLSYLIGFTTAFIGYGLATDEEYLAPLVVAPAAPSQLGTVVGSITPVEVPEVTVPPRAEAGDVAYETEEGLFMEVAGEARLISPDQLTTPFPELNPHTSVATYVVSTTKDYMFYCTISVIDSIACNPFVYSWADNTIYPVSIGSINGTFDSSMVKAAWSSDGRLQVNQYVSVSASAPWQLE